MKVLEPRKDSRWAMQNPRALSALVMLCQCRMCWHRYYWGLWACLVFPGHSSLGLDLCKVKPYMSDHIGFNNTRNWLLSTLTVWAPLKPKPETRTWLHIISEVTSGSRNKLVDRAWQGRLVHYSYIFRRLDGLYFTRTSSKQRMPPINVCEKQES